MPGERISQAHGTTRPIDPETGASHAMGFALYHPAAALRSTEVERQSYADVALIPKALLEARERRGERPGAVADASPDAVTVEAAVASLGATVATEAATAGDVATD